ncbi:MAG TPA: ATP-binding protein, partial [Telluria sp.]|nr:ATP-binding protein [Telluria sp.]
DTRHELDELLDSHLAQAAALLLAQPVAAHDGEAHRDAPLLHRYAQRTAFQVFHDGRLVLHSANAPTAPMATHGGGFASVERDGQRWRVFSASDGEVQVHVAEQEGSRRDILEAVLRGTLWPLALALPLLAPAIWWAVRRGAAPLRVLGEGLAGRAADSLEPLPLARVPAEVLPMVEALNGLFTRIAALIESERRFTADAAHELRTPLAAIRMQAQVALNEADSERRQRALTATVHGCDRAARLVEQLLTLARLERGNAPALAPVDLAAVARTVVADLAPGALAKEQQLELDARSTCPLAGNEPLLAILVRNLVDNAVRYAPRGARIRVEVDDAGITVEDSGPGMNEQDMVRLGERFFRVTGTGETGSGLGWSIARRIAQVHGLRLAARRSPLLGGLSVQLRRDPAHDYNDKGT